LNKTYLTFLLKIKFATASTPAQQKMQAAGLACAANCLTCTPYFCESRQGAASESRMALFIFAAVKEKSYGVKGTL